VLLLGLFHPDDFTLFIGLNLEISLDLAQDGWVLSDPPAHLYTTVAAISSSILGHRTRIVYRFGKWQAGIAAVAWANIGTQKSVQKKIPALFWDPCEHQG
jgi:hypothetical protein